MTTFSAENIKSRIFIGGIGRSGTTNLIHVLSQHPEINALPEETHIITHSRGLRRLFDALTVDFTGEGCTPAVTDFIHLMKLTFGGDPTAILHSIFRMDRMFGLDVFYGALETFLKEILVEGTPDPYAGAVNGLFQPSIGRFFPDQEVLLGHMRNFIDQLFGAHALTRNKNIWCEKTPENNIQIDFIYRLFPEAHFIHIKRNPYAVVASWLAMSWAPRNLEGVLNILEGLYTRWAVLKQSVPFSKHRYLEIRLEDLSQNSQKSTDEIFKFLGLSSIEGQTAFQKSVHEARSAQMPPEFKAAINKRLGRFFPLMGYEIEKV